MRTRRDPRIAIGAAVLLLLLAIALTMLVARLL